MKAIFSLSTICSLGLGITTSIICLQLSTKSAQAEFTCGPNMTTYQVTSPDGTLGGVRCVKFINAETRDGNMLHFVWYGEGKWGDFMYRHLGSSSINQSSDQQINQAADIYDNGENADGVFTRLKFSGSTNNRTIKVSGDWNETWTQAVNGVVKNYSSQLPPLKSCGKNFHRYIVTNSDDQPNSGTGIRCIDRKKEVWYGEGDWNGTRYAHIGFKVNQSYGATDLCDASKSLVCGDFPIGSLKMKTLGEYCSSPEKLKIGGSWNEVWTNNPATYVKNCL